MHLFLKYREYFENFLHSPVEKIINSTGIIIAPSEERRHKPEGWSLYYPLRAFQSENVLFVSCIPEWENELRDLLQGSELSKAYSLITQYFNSQKKFLSCDYHKIYCLNELNQSIETTQAVLLTDAHYKEFVNFHRKVSPVNTLVDSETWLSVSFEEFEEMLNRKIRFCVFCEKEIVCMTDSEDLPGKPMNTVSLGIQTLPEHRRKGYASIACAASIKYHLHQMLKPLWQCDKNNAASEALAVKLGFKYVGNDLFVSSLLADFD